MLWIIALFALGLVATVVVCTVIAKRSQAKKREGMPDVEPPTLTYVALRAEREAQANRNQSERPNAQPSVKRAPPKSTVRREPTSALTDYESARHTTGFDQPPLVIAALYESPSVSYPSSESSSSNNDSDFGGGGAGGAWDSGSSDSGSSDSGGSDGGGGGSE